MSSSPSYDVVPGTVTLPKPDDLQAAAAQRQQETARARADYVATDASARFWVVAAGLGFVATIALARMHNIAVEPTSPAGLLAAALALTTVYNLGLLALNETAAANAGVRDIDIRRRRRIEEWHAAQHAAREEAREAAQQARTASRASRPGSHRHGEG